MILKEDLFTDAVELELPVIEVSEIEPKTPAVGEATGVANLIHDLLIDEHEAVESYNQAIANMEHYPEIVSILQDVAGEEMNHIGMLEQALSTISPNAENINQGTIEAAQDLGLINADPGSPVDESLNEEAKVTIPAPYDKYFDIISPEELGIDPELDIMPGQEIDDCDCTLLAYLQPKNPESPYEAAILTDDKKYPVVDWVGGRLYPINIEEVGEALNEGRYDYEDWTIKDLIDHLHSVIEHLETEYDPDQKVEIAHNTYFVSSPHYLSTTGGFIDLDYPVAEDEEEYDDDFDM